MAKLEIAMIPALSDNYVYLAHEPESGETAVIDPAEAGPVLEAAQARGWTIGHILNTHHHADHTAGNLDVQAATGAPIAGPSYDADRIPGITRQLSEGDIYKLGAAEAKVFFTPGHTKGHISLWFHNAEVLFSGDTLFSLGCGRLFEGSPADMWASLKKLRDLPAETRVYCGHEYTETNARCALTCDPENQALKTRAEEVFALRKEGKPTIPSTLGVERAANPFLRADDPAVAKAMGLDGKDPVTVFAALRERRNTY